MYEIQYLANAVAEMFELDRGKGDVGGRSSLQSKVGAYLVKSMPTEAVTKAICTLARSDSWGKTMIWKNRWVHEQTLVGGLGIVYNREKRWKSFVEADGTRGYELSFGGGDKPEYSVEDVLGFVSSAFEGFLRTFDEVVSCYLGILSKAGMTQQTEL
jgi:hypothetical protein